MKHKTFLSALLFCSTLMFSQVEGYVFDIGNNQGIAGAYVFSSENVWTITDANGYFKLENVSRDSVRVSHLGYSIKTIKPETSQINRVGLSPDYILLENVNVSAWQGMEHLKNVTGNISILDLEDERSMQYTLNDQLEKLPGVDVNNGAFNTNKLVIRGIGSRSQYATFGVKAYINNIPVTSGDGSTSLEDFSPGIFSRAELIKGPSSAMYGAGLGGVLKFTTVTGRSGPWLVLNSGLASYNTFDNSAMLSVKRTNFSALSAISGLQSAGFRENSKFKRFSWLLLPEFNKGRFQLNGLFLYSSIYARIPSSIDGPTFKYNPREAAFTWKNSKGYEDYDRMVAGLGIVLNMGKDIYFNSSFFVNSFEGLERRPFNTLGTRNTGFGNRSFVTKGFSKFNAMAGFEILQESGRNGLFETLETASGQLLNSSNDLKTYSNLFIMFRSNSTEKFNWNVSANFNEMNYQLYDTYAIDTIDVSNNVDFKGRFSPRLGLGYQLAEGENVYLSVSNGFSPPTFEESLNSGNVFNAEIKPASGIMFEGGVRGRYFFKSLYHDITFYHARVKNLLVTKRISEEIFTNINAGSTRHTGFEFFIKHQWPYMPDESGLHVTSVVSASVGWHQFEKFVDGTQDFSKNYLPGIPEESVFVSSNIEWGQFFTEIKFKHNGEMYLNDANDIKTGPYSFTSVNAGRNFMYKQNKFVFTAGIKNIFNMVYPSMVLINAPSFGGNEPRYYYPAMPRNYFIALKILFF